MFTARMIIIKKVGFFLQYIMMSGKSIHFDDKKNQKAPLLQKQKSIPDRLH